MKFDKDIFKKHYGKIYLDSMLIISILDIIFLSIIFLAIALKIKPPAILVYMLLMLPALSIFIIPIIYAYYIKALNMSRRQKQWLDGHTLHVAITPEDGFTWGGNVKHTKHYVFDIVGSVRETNRYLIILGKISLTDNYNGTIEKKELNRCKIPRNFTDDWKIYRLLNDWY